MSTQIDRLQALLARIQKRAVEPRPIQMMTVAPPTAIATVPPSADARAAIAKEIRISTPPPMAPPPMAPPPAVEPAESRSQLVAARPEAEPQEEALELDDRHVVAEEAAVTIEVEEEAPPPSSRRPKPLEEMPEPAIPHPAPPESGRHIAAQELDFEDDLTGVREARREEPPPPKEEVISLQPVAEPEKPRRHSMEMDIPTLGASSPAAFVPEVQAPAPIPTPAPPTPPMARPEPMPARAPAASEVQIVHGEAATGEVAAFEGQAPAFAPKTFGELLDAALSL